MLQEALNYLGRASIIPLNGKIPAIPSWKEFQTMKATPEQVTEWWTKNPKYNIGIVTGKLSNITVVDVDTAIAPEWLPSTVKVKTGKGWHFYYQYEEGVQNKARIFEDIDIRGEGGYVVAPPSVHPDTGKIYEWVSKGNIQPFPKEKFGVTKKANDWDTLLTGSAQGQRNATASQVIGKLMRITSKDLWESIVWGLAKSWNLQNNPPMDESELRLVYESIGSREKLNDRTGIDDQPEDQEIKIVHVSETEDLFMSDEKYKTGIPMIDEAIGGGCEEGDLLVVSAPTGMGKTTIMQTLTKNFSSQQLPSLWFSYEVLMKNLWKNFQEMGIGEYDVVFAPFKTTSGSVDFIDKCINKAKEQAPPKIVFIDHLGYLVPHIDKSSVSSNYSAYLQQVCKELKTIAIQQRVIIVLAVHMRKTDNPKIEDIRDSSGIAQEADTVITLNREVLDTEDEYYSNRTQISVVKNRKTGKTIRRWFVLKDRCFIEDVDNLEYHSQLVKKQTKRSLIFNNK